MNKKEILKKAKDNFVTSVADIALSYKKTNAEEELVKISNAGTVYDFFMKYYYDSTVMKIKEYFYIILLNRNNKITSVSKISEGGIAGTVVDMRLIATTALLKLATGVIMIHNHPSGNLSPSEGDKAITKKAEQALALIDVKMLDHIIVTDKSFYSFTDEGLI